MEDLYQSNDPTENLPATLLTLLDGTEDPVAVNVGEARREAITLLKQLQNCPEILPSLYSQMLELPVGTTYAEAATYLLEEIGSDNKA